MQTNYKSLADVKKRISVVNGRNNHYNHAPLSTAKNMSRPQLSVVDAWLYRIVIIGLSVCIVKIIAGLLLK